MPTSRRPPPIQYLTVFVAAARHNSFKLAAEALNVSPSAISQQIKTLERHLGLSLFSRHKRELQLTHAGNSFFQVATKTVDQYEAGYTRFKEKYFSSSLKVSMIPYIANELIIPKLHQFQENYPDINLVIETTMQVEDLESTELDAAIRFGTPPWNDYHTDLIAESQSGLVATKDYFDKHPILTAADWQQQTLIHIRSDINDWQQFMDLTGIQFKPKKELYFDSYAAAIRAAEEGLGIAMGVFPIIKHKILNGQLSTFSNKHTPLKESFYLVTQTNDSKQENYQRLLEWLREIFTDAQF